MAKIEIVHLTKIGTLRLLSGLQHCIRITRCRSAQPSSRFGYMNPVTSNLKLVKHAGMTHVLLSSSNPTNEYILPFWRPLSTWVAKAVAMQMREHMRALCHALPTILYSHSVCTQWLHGCPNWSCTPCRCTHRRRMRWTRLCVWYSLRQIQVLQLWLNLHYLLSTRGILLKT